MSACNICRARLGQIWGQQRQMPREQLRAPRCCGVLRRPLRWVKLYCQHIQRKLSSLHCAMPLLWFMVEQLMQMH